jgi:hypothetical protein
MYATMASLAPVRAPTAAPKRQQGTFAISCPSARASRVVRRRARARIPTPRSTAA